jgi:hypothetical protein
VTNISLFLIWSLGVLCIGTSVLGLVLLDASVSKNWLLLPMISSGLMIWFGPRGNILSVLWFFCMFIILVLFMRYGSKRQERIYKFGANFGKAAMPPIGLGPYSIWTQSILTYVVKIIKTRHETTIYPPIGYWTVEFPAPMVRSKDYQIIVRFPAISDTSEMRDERLDRKNKTTFNVGNAILSVKLVAEAFKVKESVKKLEFHNGSVLTTEFLVKPISLGNHQVSIQADIGKNKLDWIHETIQVNNNIQKVIATFGIIATIFGVILVILNAQHFKIW